MCYFITNIIPAKIDQQKADVIIKEYGFQYQSIINPFVAKQLNSDMVYVRLRRSLCDCGTALGSRIPLDRTEFEDEIMKKVAMFKKKGWSQSKIERWKAQKIEANEKVESKLAGVNGSESARWISFIKKLRQDAGANFVGIMLHFYTGGLIDERISINETVKMKIDEVDEEYITKMKEDVLYVFS